MNIHAARVSTETLQRIIEHVHLVVRSAYGQIR
jgi:hypothetical protein